MVHAGYAKEVVAALSSQELDMALQDRVARETSDAKNALEGYVYNMRDSLSTRLAPYEKEDVRAAFSKELDGVEVCATQSCLACLSLSECCNSAHNSCLSAVVHVRNRMQKVVVSGGAWTHGVLLRSCVSCWKN